LFVRITSPLNVLAPYFLLITTFAAGMALWTYGQALLPSNAAAFATTIAILYILWYVVSAVWAWYQLRHFKGPIWASFSYLWGYFAMNTGHMHLRLLKEQEKHGKIVRIGPNELLVYDAETLGHMNSVRSNYGRGDWYASIQFDPYGHSVLSEPNTTKHDQRKAKIIGGYSNKGNMNLEKDVDSQIAVMVDLIKTKYACQPESPLLDLGRLVRFFQVDLVTLVGIGEPWGDLKSETDQFDFIAISDTFVPFLHCFMMIPYLRDLFASKLFLMLAGPKATDEKGMGRFLGYVLRNSLELGRL
jgi:hypothetical protein